MTYPPPQPFAPVPIVPATPPKRGLSTGAIVAIVIGGCFALCLAVCLFAGFVPTLLGRDAGSTPVPTIPDSGTLGAPPRVSADPPTATPVAPAAGVNQPVRDGKFEFTVTKVRCGVAKVGSGFLTKTAQGQFCLVSVTVSNKGNEADLFDASNQYAYNPVGQRYSADSGAGIYLEDNGNAFLNEINPGNSVKGVVVFDIPKGAKIVRLELHESFFSTGVTVALG